MIFNELYIYKIVQDLLLLICLLKYKFTNLLKFINIIYFFGAQKTYFDIKNFQIHS